MVLVLSFKYVLMLCMFQLSLCFSMFLSTVFLLNITEYKFLQNWVKLFYPGNQMLQNDLNYNNIDYHIKLLIFQITLYSLIKMHLLLHL